MKPDRLVLGVMIGVVILLVSFGVFITDQAIGYEEFSGSITKKYSAIVKSGFGSAEEFYFLIDDTKEMHVGRATYFQHDQGDTYVWVVEYITVAGVYATLGAIAGIIIVLLILVLHAQDRNWAWSERKIR